MFKRFVPKEYSELLEYISPAALQTIDWKVVLKNLGALSKNLLDSRSRSLVLKSQQDLMGGYLKISESKIKESDKTDDLEILAKGILYFYFTQFFGEMGLYLDLRLKNFEMRGGQSVYVSNGLWWRFEDSFRSGMLNTYEGFYFEKPALLRQGMEKSGLIPIESSEELFRSTKDLLFKHFGTVKSEDHLFTTRDFKQSFHDLFMHLKKNKIRLPADFMFLGIYLTTLYQSLEGLSVPVRVKDIVEQVWSRQGRPPKAL